jgi:precorrin-2/cobalt-factor-2 C20-methyltransferase
LIAVMPMTQDSEATARAYGQLTTGIVGELGQGQDVVFLCEGDPLLYGSFANLLQRMGERFDCEIIPGITSITAAAAAAVVPLGHYDEPIALFPATAGPQRLSALLRQCDRVVVMKVGRHLAKLKETLSTAGMAEGAVLVENATLPTQKVRPLSVAADEQVGYFSLIIAGRKRGRQ